MNRLLLASILLFTLPLAAQTREEAIAKARTFLALKPDEARAYIQTLSAPEARALSSQILQLSRAKNPDMEKLAPVLEHLANIAALETGQKRLNNLLLVIVLTLVLFSAFLAFTLLDQRRILRALTDRSLATTPEAAEPPVLPRAKTGGKKRRR